MYGKPNRQNPDVKVSDTRHAIHNSSIMKFAVLFYQLLFINQTKNIVWLS